MIVVAIYIYIDYRLSYYSFVSMFEVVNNVNNLPSSSNSGIILTSWVYLLLGWDSITTLTLLIFGKKCRGITSPHLKLVNIS